MRTRRILGADGSSHQSLYVVCPSRMGSEDIDTCKSCVRAQNVSPAHVECEPFMAPQIQPQSWATSIAPLRVTCVRDSVIADSLRTGAPREPWAIPVVDASSRFIGFVSSNQTAAMATTDRLAMAMRVGEIAIGRSLIVRETDSAREALRVMANHRATVVAVVDDAGTPRGVLRDLDLLRLVAGQSE